MKKLLLIIICLLSISGCINQENKKILVSCDSKKVISVNQNECKEIMNLIKRLEFHGIPIEDSADDCKKLYINKDGIIHCYYIFDDGTIKYDMNKYKNAETYNIEIAKKLSIIIEKIYKEKGVYNN